MRLYPGRTLAPDGQVSYTIDEPHPAVGYRSFLSFSLFFCLVWSHRFSSGWIRVRLGKTGYRPSHVKASTAAATWYTGQHENYSFVL